MAAATASNLSFAYDADTLYRTPTGDPNVLAPVRLEAARLLGAESAGGGLSSDERNYLIASIASRTGVSPAQAAQRVDAVQARERGQRLQARIAADDARDTGATLALLTGLSMLVGAFIASASAVLGGLQRDLHP
jgi:phosphomannomutase